MISYQNGRTYGGIKSVEAGLDYVPTHGWEYREHGTTAGTTTSGWMEDQHLTVSGEKFRFLHKSPYKNYVILFGGGGTSWQDFFSPPKLRPR